MFVKRYYLAHLSYEGSFLSSLLISAKMGCYWLFIKALGDMIKNQLRKEAVEKNKFYQPENIKDPKNVYPFIVPAILTSLSLTIIPINYFLWKIDLFQINKLENAIFKLFVVARYFLFVTILILLILNYSFFPPFKRHFSW